MIRVDIGGRLTLGKVTAADDAPAATGDLTNVVIKLFHPGDQNDTTDPLQDWTDASVAADGTIYYDISAELADDADKNYRAMWRFTLDSRTQYRDQIFHIVQTIFALTWTATDLDREEGWLAKFAQITTALKTAAIEAARDDIWSKIKGIGRWPWLVFNQHDINRCVHYRAMMKLCLGQAHIDNDWGKKFSEYRKMFKDLWSTIAISASDSDDATPDDTNSAGEIELSRV